MAEPTRKSVSNVWRDAIRDAPADELDWKARLGAFVLSTYMDGGGAIVDPNPQRRVSRAALARGAAVSDRSVDAALGILEQHGWLAIDPPAKRRVVGVDDDGREVVKLVRPGGAA